MKATSSSAAANVESLTSERNATELISTRDDIMHPPGLLVNEPSYNIAKNFRRDTSRQKTLKYFGIFEL